MSPKVADLSVDELRDLLRTTIRELVEELVDEKLHELVDPDEGMEMREEVIESLRDYLKSDRQGKDADEVFRSLGLE